jgi:hypothetical protein
LVLRHDSRCVRNNRVGYLNVPPARWLFCIRRGVWWPVFRARFFALDFS